MKWVVWLSILSLGFSSPVFASDFTDLLRRGESSFRSEHQAHRDSISEQRRRAAAAARERERNRDRSRDVCYQLSAGSDAQLACLGDNVYAIRNERARNILLGHCHSLGSSSFDRDLGYICSVGSSGCHSLRNGDASYWCTQCGGTRRWLAVYSLGHVLQCYR